MAALTSVSDAADFNGDETQFAHTLAVTGSSPPPPPPPRQLRLLHLKRNRDGGTSPLVLGGWQASLSHPSPEYRPGG